MKNTKRKLNKLKVRRCILIVSIILLFIVMMIVLKINKKNNRYKNLTILLNNEFISTINNVIIDEQDNILFSKEDISNIFDKTIYYNEAEKELITTYDTHVALLKVDEKYALINDENIELNGKLQEVDKKVYIPITDLEVVYDIDIEYAKKSNRIIIDSTKKKKVESTILKKTSVKNKKGMFSDKLEKLIIGDKVTMLESSGKYKKIRTSLGNIGYVKNKVLSDEILIREDVQENKKELNVYNNYSNISGVYEDIIVDESKLNVVIPTFFYIDKNSKVLDKTTSNTATYAVYKGWAERNKLEILPVLDNNETISISLLSYSQRSQVINSLKDFVKKYNYVGININFNTIDDINSFYRFVLELVPRFKEAGLKVAVTLNNNIDRARIKDVVDYIIEK